MAGAECEGGMERDCKMKQKIDEEEIDKNEIAKEFELIFKGNQAILCISSEFNEDPMLYGVYIIAGRIYSKQRLIMNASFSELQQIAEDLENFKLRYLVNTKFLQV